MQKKHLIYVSPHLYCYGETPRQIFNIRNLYNENEYKVTIITYPMHKRRLNKALYNIITRGINVIQTTDSDLIWFSANQQNNNIINENEHLYAIYSNVDSSRRLNEKFLHSEPEYHFSLSEIDIQMGDKIRKDFGIPDDAKIITIHIREQGWFGKTDIGTKATLKNYIPAINYLIEKGFYIVRLGDTSMTELNTNSSKIIDAPFHPSYRDIVDPYFLSKSTFFIGTASGPSAVSNCFGIPTLYTNYYLSNGFNVLSNNDLYIFQKHYSKQLKRYLTYEEILLSPNQHFTNSESCENADLKFIENTEEEILKAVQEMYLRLKNSYQKDDESRKIIKHIQKIELKARTVFPDLAYLPMYNLMNFGKNYLSLEFLKLNPEFVGHILPES